jgi:catechol 2,3-dioxygenase-like lactoylglutathione lyase family enzyme
MATARLLMVNIDCPDPHALVAFYRDLLGWDVAHDEDEYGMITQDATAIGFGRIQPYTPPPWPDPDGSKQFHLDLAVDDIPAAERRARELGATVPDHQPGERWRVLLDPAGHPFCLTAGG